MSETIIELIEKVLKEVMKSCHETSSYRFLRAFSGTVSIPYGKDGFDS